MKKTIFISLFIGFSFFIHAANKPSPVTTANKKPFLFMENKGQIIDEKGTHHPEVLFTAEGKGVKLFFKNNGISYMFANVKKGKEPKALGEKFPVEKSSSSRMICRMDMQLVGANPQTQIERLYKSTYYENYYLPHCNEGKGITNVGGYEKVVYKNIYPNIDWVLYSDNHKMKYDFIIHPGGNPKDIKMKYSQPESIDKNDDGSVTVNSLIGTIIEEKPFTFQDLNKEIVSDFIVNENILSFNVGTYNKQKDLIIDPGLFWSTYFGGLDEELPEFDLVLDNQGNSYLTGQTKSIDLGIGVNFTQSSVNSGNTDVFIAKMDENSNVLWATYYGGSEDDVARKLQFSSTTNQNQILLVGYTLSNNLPILNGFQSVFGTNHDGFIVRFGAHGYLQKSSYWGDANDDYILGQATDSQGNIYLCGSTDNFNLASSANSYQPTNPGFYSGFLMKLDSNWTKLWGTYIGGGASDALNVVGLNNSGQIYSAGYSYSAGIALNDTNSFHGGQDGIVASFDPMGNILLLRYFGGSGDEDIVDLAVNTDPLFQDRIVVCGNTTSINGISNWPCTQCSNGGAMDAFITQFLYDDNGGTSTSNNLKTVSSNYVGGPLDDQGIGVAFNGGDSYIVGKALSFSGISANNGYQLTGADDGFLSYYSGPYNSLQWSTYFGGNGPGLVGVYEALWAVAVNPNYNPNFIATAGWFNSGNLCINGANPDWTGWLDAGVAVFARDCNSTPNPLAISSSTGSFDICNGSSTTLNVIGGSNYLWNGTIGGNSINVSTTGNYTVTGFAYGCQFTKSVSVNVNPLPTVSISPSGAQYICQGSSLVLSAQATLNTSGTYDGINGITITPAGATGNDTITITVNPASTCEVASNLLGTTQARLHAGLGYNSFSYNPNTLSFINGWLNPVDVSDTNSTTWFNSQPNGTWTKTFVPRTYFNAPVDSNIKYLCMLVNGGPVGNMWAKAARNTVPSTGQCTGDFFIPFPISGAITGSSQSANYQWFKDGISIPGAVDSIYTAVTSGSYTVQVTNANNCSVVSFPTQVFVNTNPPASITASSTEICAGSSTTLTANNAAVSYQWLFNGNPIPGATLSSYLANATGNYSVLETSPNTCDSTSNEITITVYPYPTAVITYTGIPYTCLGGSVSFTANTGSGYTYQWLNNGNIIPAETNSSYTATSSANYQAIVTNAGICADTSNAVLVDPPPPIPNLCVVTTDSLGIFNQIFWDKTPFVNVADSFIVYRYCVASSNYVRIGSVPFDSLSLFIDTAFNICGPNGGNPKFASQKYKLSLRDFCGIESTLSSFHQTVFVQQNAQNFNWNAYSIENGPSFIDYNCMRDDLGNNNWQLLVAVSALNATDPNYLNFPLANYRIETIGFNCEATRASINKTRSNIRLNALTALPKVSNEKAFIISPNPTSESFNVNFPEFTPGGAISIKIYDMLGALVLSNNITAKNTSIAVVGFATGMYNIQMVTEKGTYNEKLIIK